MRGIVSLPARQEATNARFVCPEALIAALHRKPRLVVRFFIGAGFLPMRHALFSRRRSPCPFGGPFRDPQRRLFLPKPEEAAHVLQSSVPALSAYAYQTAVSLVLARIALFLSISRRHYSPYDSWLRASLD